ncbi:hypothetical protein [Streptomyces sp. NPDC021020]|uniref:hypothetical protein n=1 Tax=Streptomyces sp. NPDC021020 TaxID=3365109 RepID=UPI0037B7A90D
MLSGDQPYDGHDPATVLLLLLAGAVATPWLLARGIRLALRARSIRSATAIRSAATLAGCATVGMYTWGVLHLLFFDDADRATACNAAVGKGHLTGYEPSFIPLHFGCRSNDGRTMEAVIPSYLNSSVITLAACAVALTTVAVIARRRTDT